jgi:UDP-glucose 4-epimerase
VLVTGASGAVGRIVTRALADAGAHVHALLRRPTRIPGVSSVEIGDITDPTAVDRAVQGCDALVHLAALLHIPNPPAALADEYARVNDDATAHLVASSRDAGVSRVVFASTISVYGPPGADVMLDERSACHPDTPYARTKLAAETHVRAATRADGEALGVVLRLAAVYGVGVKGNYRRLLEALARRRYVQVGAGRNRRVLVHEADVARAVLLALTHPDAPGQTFNVTDGEVHEVREIVACMCDALGEPVPRVRVPVRLARMGAGMLELGSRLMGRSSPVTRAALDKLVEDVAVDGRLLQQRLGFVPQMSLSAGWRDVVSRMGRDTLFAGSQADD